MTEIIASVDSAPWLRLLLELLRPSQPPPVRPSRSGILASLSPRNHATLSFTPSSSCCHRQQPRAAAQQRITRPHQPAPCRRVPRCEPRRGRSLCRCSVSHAATAGAGLQASSEMAERPPRPPGLSVAGVAGSPSHATKRRCGSHARGRATSSSWFTPVWQRALRVQDVGTHRWPRSRLPPGTHLPEVWTRFRDN
jgi:hypothetical protein